MIEIGLGISRAMDSYQAGKSSALQARIHITKNLPCVGIIFSSIDLQPSQILEGVYSVFPNIKIIGSSAAGIITPFGVDYHAAAMMIISSDKIHFIADSLEENQKNENFYNTGYNFSHRLLKLFGKRQRDFFLFFSDGLHFNASELVSGIHASLGTSFPVVGGISSDDLHFARSVQYCNNKSFSDSYVGALCKLGLNFSIASHHGWKPLGRPRLVTKAADNLLIEIEGRPAISIYEDYFGPDHIKDLEYGPNSLMSLLYPLGIYKEGEKEYLLRNIISVKNRHTLICQGDVKPNEEIRLMIGNKNSCLEAAQSALSEAKSGLKTNKPRAAIIFDSIIRAKLLGRNVHEEIEITKNILGKNTPFLGFYSYGEYTPFESLSYRGHASLHNGTFSTLLLGE